MKRDDYQCVVCGKGPKYLNLSHILPEEIIEYRLNLDNVVMLCPKHHKLGNYSCHKNPIWFSNWLKKNLPIKFFLAIKRIEELNGT